MTSNVSTLLTFANLQMAAEARLDLHPDLFTALREGNNRSSKFPEVLAQQFAAQWEVVARQSSTSAGLRGARHPRRVQVTESSLRRCARVPDGLPC